MSALITAQELIDRYGVIEIGQLLTNNGETIDPAGNARADFVAVMYVGGVEADGLIASVSTEIEQYITDAQSELEGILSERYAIPLKDDGTEITTGNIPMLFKKWCKAVARWYMHDRVVDEFDIVRMDYNKAIKDAEKCANGSINPNIGSLTKIDSNSTASDLILFSI